MKRGILFTEAILLVALVLVTGLQASGPPTDKTASPARDRKLVSIMRGAADHTGTPVEVMHRDFRKIRGNTDGSNSWENEQWAGLITVRNPSGETVRATIHLRLLNASGAILDELTVFDDALAPSETRRVAKHLIIQLRYINEIVSAELVSVPAPGQ